MCFAPKTMHRLEIGQFFIFFLFYFIQKRERDLTDLVKKITKTARVVLTRDKFDVEKEKPTQNPTKNIQKKRSSKRKQLTLARAINTHFTIGQIVWAKMRGYSNWPARVSKHGTIPNHMQSISFLNVSTRS